MLGWANDELASRSGVSRNMIQMLVGSNETRGTVRTLRAVVAALEDAGIAFIHDTESGAFGAVLRAEMD